MKLKNLIILVALLAIPNLTLLFVNRVTQNTSAQTIKSKTPEKKKQDTSPRIKQIIKGSEKPEQIPDNIAFELFLRTIAEGNARGLVGKAGFNDEEIEKITGEANSLNELLELSDRRAFELKANKSNFEASQLQKELSLLQIKKDETVNRSINRFLLNNLGNEQMGKLRDFVKTEVKGNIQKILTNDLKETISLNKKFAKSFTSNKAVNNGGQLYLYSTAWQDGTNVFGSGSLSEEYSSETSYRVTVSVASSSGRSNTTESDWDYAPVSNVTGLSGGIEDGVFTAQVSFEESSGYYDEYNNFVSMGSSSLGINNLLIEVPPRVSLKSVSVAPTSIGKSQTANLLATVTYSQSIDNDTTIDMELIDATTTASPHPNYTIGNPTVIGGSKNGETNNNRTVSLKAPPRNETDPIRSQQVIFPLTTTGTTSGGTVNLEIVVGNLQFPSPAPTPLPTIVPPVNRDVNLAITVSPTPTPTPSPNPTPPPTGGGDCLAEAVTTWEKLYNGGEKAENSIPGCACSGSNEVFACYQSGGQWDWNYCFCGGSPIVLDVAGNGFNLTSLEDGIVFDIIGRGTPRQVAWTSADSDDAWLVLDRNQNSRIDDGKELFGDNSEQPVGQNPKQGFSSLGMFDKPERGGNDDGKITRRDTIFRKLRLWQDRNHNGISEPEELFRLPALDVVALSLDYKVSRYRDQHGNWFKYRARVRDRQNANVGRWAWDVFLRINP